MCEPEPAPESKAPGAGYEIKVYLVIQQDRVTREGEPNRRVLAAKLNKKAAEDVVAKIPGTYVQKVIATK